jgi:hypothetical protein
MRRVRMNEASTPNSALLFLTKLCQTSFVVALFARNQTQITSALGVDSRTVPRIATRNTKKQRSIRTKEEKRKDYDLSLLLLLSRASPFHLNARKRNGTKIRKKKNRFLRRRLWRNRKGDSKPITRTSIDTA